MSIIAISDVGTRLYAKIGAAVEFTPFLDVIATPATGGAPNRLEATPLSSVKERFIKGRSTQPEMEFDFNYTEANFALALTAKTGQPEEFLIVYGDGSGAFIEGEADAWIEGVGRNSTVIGKFYIAPQDVEYKTAVEVAGLVSEIEAPNGEGESEGESEGT